MAPLFMTIEPFIWGKRVTVRLFGVTGVKMEKQETEKDVWLQICDLLEIHKSKFEGLWFKVQVSGSLIELLKEIRDKTIENLINGAGYPSVEEAIKHLPWIREWVNAHPEIK